MDHVRYEVVDHIAVITLDRPTAANAQSTVVLRELDEAWSAADRDHDVAVIVLCSTGKNFSAGHDMTEPVDGGFTTEAGTISSDRYYDWEYRGYLNYAKRWREVPKPSIAAVQGKCIAAGLMLCWPCDLIVAADDALFSDPVLLLGIPGVEFQAHAWEFGPRKAKELLFTGDPFTAAEALHCGMVNRVVPRAELQNATLDLARRIARQNSWALQLAKRSVNRAMDEMGFSNAIESCFDIHHLGHGHATTVNEGRATVLVDLEAMKRAGK